MDVSVALCRRIAYLRALKEAQRWCARWTHTSSRGRATSAKTFSYPSEVKAKIVNARTLPHGVRRFSRKSAAKPVLSAERCASTLDNQKDDKIFHRTNGNPPLPLPPFLRKAPWQKTSVFERSIKNPRPSIEGGYIKGNRKTLRAKLKEAEFATRMQENPYARMLAEPVREDRFSQQRLPRHCMLKFQIVEDETHVSETSKLEQSDSNFATQDPLRPESTSNLVFLPLSLMGEALPKTKSRHHLTTSQKAAVSALHDDTAFTPHGPGSNLLARYDMLAWVSAGGNQERVKRVLSTRARDALEKSSHSRRSKRDKTGPVVWQTDMPELVLAAMRKVVKRLLGFMLKNKSSQADRSGIVMEVPRAPDGMATLALLDKVDDVMCVLRTGTADVPDERYSQQHPPQHVETQWKERERDSFLNGVKPLPPSEGVVHDRWPTLSYRNRRVMLFDLPTLLGGQEQARKLVDSTVFERSEWLILRGSLGTTQLQQWLFRLHGYLTHGKGEKVSTASK